MFEWLTTLPVMDRVVGYFKYRREEKRSRPVVSLRAELAEDEMHVLLLHFIVTVSTDVTIEDFHFEYTLQTSLRGYGKDIPTTVTREAVYAGQPLPVTVVTFKSDAGNARAHKELEINVPIFMKYSLKTGEKKERYCSAVLKRGSSEPKIVNRDEEKR